MERRHKAEVQALSSAQRGEIGQAIKRINFDRRALTRSSHGSFLSERAALIQRQDVDKAQIKAVWRRFNEG